MNNNEDRNKVGITGMRLGPRTDIFSYVAAGDGRVTPEKCGTVHGVIGDDTVIVPCGRFGSTTLPPQVKKDIKTNQATRIPRDCDKEPNKGPEAQSNQMGLPLVTTQGQEDQAGPEF